MSAPPTPQPTALGRTVAKWLDYAVFYAFEIVLVLFILYLCIARGLSFSIDVYEPLEPRVGALSEASMEGWMSTVGQSLTVLFTDHQAAVVAAPPVLADSAQSPTIETGYDDFNAVAPSDDPAPHISNLTLVLSPDYGQRKGLPAHVVAAKRARVQHYLDRYVAIAQREMRDHGIPASITLAQGLLESNAGDSKLAVNSNNHFGIKCRSKCLGCTCRNYGDDTRYDMFRVFTSAAESFREHSALLTSERYAKLKHHGKDYRKWAHGLKSCGYATDQRYAQKLITIIENLDLDRYDEQVP